jgi:hypothetical protein
MDSLIEQVLNSSLMINLPPVFTVDTTNPVVKKDGATPSGKLDNTKKKGKKCKGKGDNDAAREFIKNKKNDGGLQVERRGRLVPRLQRQEHK